MKIEIKKKFFGETTHATFIKNSFFWCWKDDLKIFGITDRVCFAGKLRGLARMRRIRASILMIFKCQTDL